MAEIPGERLPIHTVNVLRLTWLSDTVFELVLGKPRNFTFHPGQKALIESGGICREYTLASSAEEKELAFCIRFISKGALSEKLATIAVGDFVGISDPYGFFVFRPGKAVFVATGTGIAPFVAYAKSGVRGHLLLHGVRSEEELYYRNLLQGAVENYIPCLSEENSHKEQNFTGFYGRVTEYLTMHLPGGRYDFYLCGNSAMIRDATLLIDQKFPDCRVFSESFFTAKTI